MQMHRHEVTGCAHCGTFQTVPPSPDRTGLFCATCRALLERTNLRSRSAALACCSAALLLFFPANLLPFLTTAVLGASRESHLISSVTAMYENGWPELSVVMLLFLLVFPFVRFILLTGVLGALELNRRPNWLGKAFRYACALETWAMPDVFLLGFAVSYARLATTISVSIGEGAICFIAVGILTLFTRAALNKKVVWEDIYPERVVAPDIAVVACQTCDLVLPADADGTICPRCSQSIRRRKPNALMRAIALTFAGVLLYIPANAYPIATLPVGFGPVKYTIIQGVVDLVSAKLIPLALLVLTASFIIPVLKLTGITWCIVSVVRRSKRHLLGKTRAYRIVEEIGRWSMVDPFVIACFVPVTDYNALLYGRAEAAAPAFTAVVILTIIAAQCFDPRLMWDVAGERK